MQKGLVYKALSYDKEKNPKGFFHNSIAKGSNFQKRLLSKMDKKVHLNIAKRKKIEE